WRPLPPEPSSQGGRMMLRVSRHVKGNSPIFLSTDSTVVHSSGIGSIHAPSETASAKMSRAGTIDRANFLGNRLLSEQKGVGIGSATRDRRERGLAGGRAHARQSRHLLVRGRLTRGRRVVATLGAVIVSVITLPRRHVTHVARGVSRMRTLVIGSGKHGRVSARD